MTARRKGAHPRPAVVPGRAWHYQRFCGVCGARPAEVLPLAEPRCRLHGGRPLRKGERMPSKARGASPEASWSINLPGSTPDQ